MAVLFSYGILIAISIILGIICFVVGLFLGNIILFDSIFLSVLTAILCNQLKGIHPAFCLLIGFDCFYFCYCCRIPGPDSGLSEFCCPHSGPLFSE